MSAGKAKSYRYGELASFEEAMMAKRMPDMWVRLHIDSMPRSYKYGSKSMDGEKRRRRQNRAMNMTNLTSNSYKYGVKKMKTEAAMVKRMLKSKALQGKEATSYKYGKKAMLRKIKSTPHGLARGQPSSYRYGQQYMKMANIKMASARRMNKPHPPFKGNKAIKSYNYGRKFNKMPRNKEMNIKRNELRNMPNPMMVNSIMALRDMPMKKNGMLKSMEEMDMIIKPLGVKPKVTRNSEQVTQYFEDSNGTLRRAEQQMDIIDVEFGTQMKQKIVNIKAFDGMDSYMEGEFMVLSSDNKHLDNLRSMMGMPRGSTMKAASLNDNWDEWKNKINLNNEYVRAAVSVLLGLCMTLFMLIFFKTLFRLWTKLGRRHENEENRNLLKGELDSIHPISIVYKN